MYASTSRVKHEFQTLMHECVGVVGVGVLQWVSVMVGNGRLGVWASGCGCQCVNVNVDLWGCGCVGRRGC